MRYDRCPFSGNIGVAKPFRIAQKRSIGRRLAVQDYRMLLPNGWRAFGLDRGSRALICDHLQISRRRSRLSMSMSQPWCPFWTAIGTQSAAARRSIGSRRGSQPALRLQNRRSLAAMLRRRRCTSIALFWEQLWNHWSPILAMNPTNWPLLNISKPNMEWRVNGGR